MNPSIMFREKKSRLDENTARKIFAQIVDTLYYLEHANVVHRDIKLENIIIDPNTLKIKFIDFGFGKVFQHVYFQKKMDLTCGTLEYMAPEILLKEGNISFCY